MKRKKCLMEEEQKKIQPPVKFQTRKPLIYKALEEIFEKMHRI